MKFDNTFTNNDSLFLKYALLQGVDISGNNNINIKGNINNNINININGDNVYNESLLKIKAEYKALVKKVKDTLDYVLNYFNNDQDDDHHDDQENNQNNTYKQNQDNDQNKNINSKYNSTIKSTNTITQTTDIDELLRDIDRIIGIDCFTGVEKQNQNNSYPTQNNIADDEIEQDIISFVDKLKLQSSKITIIEKNHIKTEIELTNNELLILKLAVLHNNNVINLMSQKDDIKNLMNKGLLHISENGCSLVVDKIVEVIIKTDTHKGNMVVAEYDEAEEGNQNNQTHGEEDSQEDTNTKKYSDNEEQVDNEELSFDDHNKNVQSFEWSIDCCADRQVSDSSSDI